MEQENREVDMRGMAQWRKVPLKVGIPFTKIFAGDHEVATCWEEEDADTILADHRFAAVARGPVREALERIIALRFKGVSPYPMSEMEYILDEVRDAAGEALSALTPPEGETAAGEKGKIQ